VGVLVEAWEMPALFWGSAQRQPWAALPTICTKPGQIFRKHHGLDLLMTPSFPSGSVVEKLKLQVKPLGTNACYYNSGKELHLAARHKTEHKIAFHQRYVQNELKRKNGLEG
jgi:hypothetical protein